MPRIKSLDLDVESHKKYLRRHIASLKRSQPKAGRNYESFVYKLLELFSDNPPTSWRFVVTSYKFPTFRVFNKRTGRLNDFLRIFPSWGMAVTPSIVDEKYRKLAEYLLDNVFIADSEDALRNSNGFVVIEKNGKYVKGKYSLTGGSVGLIEGKKIGRAKNLEKLQEEIITQAAVVELLRADIQERHNEVIAFNEDLRETTIRDTEKEIQQLTNEVFSLHNKLENLHSMQTKSLHRLEELNLQMQKTHSSVEGVRNQLTEYNQQLQVNAARLSDADEAYRATEATYNEATRQYNEFNLNVTKQQSKINALKQELELKNKQLNDLKQQIGNNTEQLGETGNNIEQSAQSLKDIEEGLVQLMKEK